MLALFIIIPGWFAASVIFAVIAGRTITIRDQRETVRVAAPEWEVAA